MKMEMGKKIGMGIKIGMEDRVKTQAWVTFVSIWASYLIILLRSTFHCIKQSPSIHLDFSLLWSAQALT
jgi:hypothetical protein